MNRITLFAIIGLTMTLNLGAIQLNSDTTKGENGETVTTVHYDKEPDGMTLKVFYGDGPKYRLLSVYYDSSNSEYLERREYHDFDASNVAHPLLMATTDYYRSDDPEERATRVQMRDNGVLKAVVKYRPGNRKNLQESIIEYKDDKHVSMQQDTFVDPMKTVGNTSVLRTYYGEHGETLMEMTKFAENEQFIDEQVLKYQPPEFTKEKGNPFRMVQTYKEHPLGLIKTETEFNAQGNPTVLQYYNYKLTKEGYSRMLKIYDGPTIMKKVTYFDDKPFNGSIYLAVTVRTKEGTYLTNYFNKAGQLTDAMGQPVLTQ